MENCLFCDEDLKENPTFVKGYQNHAVLLNYAQPTLGSVLIVPYAHFTNIAQLSKQEAREFMSIRRDLDRALRDNFNPDTINYYELFMVEPHLHGHVVPRYKTPKEFNSRTFLDPGWGTKPKLGGKRLPQEILDPIKEVIKKSLDNFAT